MGKKFIVVESYRNSKELFNLQCWALTANAFFSKKEWIWILKNLNILVITSLYILNKKMEILSNKEKNGKEVCKKWILYF